jgi:adenylate cyclase
MSKGFINELRQRNVLKVALGYLIAAWLVAQVSDLVLESFDAPDWAMRTLLIALAIGFPIALVVSWMFEFTPKGVLLDSQVDRTVKIGQDSGRRLDFSILLILAVIVIFMGLERFLFSGRDGGMSLAEERELAQQKLATAETATSNADPAAEAAPVDLPSQKSVAVLPFAVMSTGPDDEYFADGLTEEIINALSQLPDLMVTARTSAFHFKDQNLPVGEIAGQLGVDHIVEGSVRRAGEQLRITAQLIRTIDGFHLWSETYDRRTEDSFAVQSDIAEQVATALNVLLDESLRNRMQHVGTRNVDAFIAYQKGINLHERAHTEANQISLLRQGNIHFENAVALEPTLATAYEYHSDLYAHILLAQASGQLDGDITEADVAASPALLRQDYEAFVTHARNPPELHNAEFGQVLLLGPWRALASLSEKAAAPPGCEAAVWLHLVGPAFGHGEEVLDAFRRMAACDPLSGRARVNQVGAALWLGRNEDAVRMAEQGLERMQHPNLVQQYALALAFSGNVGAAEDAARRLIRKQDELMLTLAMLAAIAGDAAAVARLEDDFLQARGPDDRGSLTLTAMTGDRNEANRLAALIDARPFGHIALLQAIYLCYCGAPFDLEATPVFAGMLEDSGLAWPPDSPFRLPLKDW